MRLRYVIERQFTVDDRSDTPRLDEAERLGELRSAHSFRAQQRDIVKEELRRIELHELTRQLSDQDPAAALGETSSRRVEYRAADIVDHRVYAFAFGQRFDAGGKLLSAADDENVVGAGGADPFRL